MIKFTTEFTQSKFAGISCGEQKQISEWTYLMFFKLYNV